MFGVAMRAAATILSGMKRLLLLLLVAVGTRSAFAQVDVEHRRSLMVQTSFSANGEEQLGGFGFYWFNENNFPRTNMALRVIFAGIYLGSELSYFLPAATNTAVGLGAGGGAFVDSVTPYVDGERVTARSFYGDAAEAHVFINHTIPNPTPLPLNLRGTYTVAGSFYREADSTAGFDLPPDFLTQTFQAEIRFGGIEPGLTGMRGAELYLSADANYRTGFDAFGPAGANYPAHSQYQRAFGSLAVKLPAGPVTVFARICGGIGEDLDQISAWKIGGNLVGVESWSLPVRGYYSREFLADDFTLANLELILPICKKCGVLGHLYGDWAAYKPVPPAAGDWHNLLGVGAGVSLRAFWGIRTLVTYGYGINAVRNGNHGNHEIALALEKSF